MPEVISSSAQIESLFWARPLPLAAMLAIFVGVVALSLYLYRRSWGLKPGSRALLGVIRMVVLTLVVATLFEPMAVFRETHTRQRGLPVLVDVSESMSMKDPRKRSEDLVEAAAALDLLSPSAAPSTDLAVLNLDVKQQQAIARASRLDLATSLLSRSARPTLESMGEDLDIIE